MPPMPPMPLNWLVSTSGSQSSVTDIPKTQQHTITLILILPSRPINGDHGRLDLILSKTRPPRLCLLRNNKGDLTTCKMYLDLLGKVNAPSKSMVSHTSALTSSNRVSSTVYFCEPAVALNENLPSAKLTFMDFSSIFGRSTVTNKLSSRCAQRVFACDLQNMRMRTWQKA